MNHSLLRWTFGVLYVALILCLPSLSLLYFSVLFLLLWEFPVVNIVGVGCVCDCQNDSIVGSFDGSGVHLHCCSSSSDCASSDCSISLIAAARSVHSSEIASASVFDASLRAFLKNTSRFSVRCISVFA